MTHPRRNAWHGVLAVVLVAVLSPTPRAVAATPPRDDVRALVNRTLDAIVAERDAIARDTSAARALIRREVLPHLDARRAARYVLGTEWARASPRQRNRFTDAFTRQMVRTYAVVLHEYTDRIVSFARGDRPITYLNRRWARHRATVSAVFHRERTDNRTEASVYVEQVDGQWRVFDVQVAGLSVLAAYRADIQARLLFLDLDELIARMEARNGD